MKCLSLFSGIGGFDLALKRQGHTIVGACEIDKYARSIYERHFPGVPVHQDATKINPKELPDFDILVAGFPCQAFSIAGKRLGFEESRGTLFYEIARVAREKRPGLLLLENVKGLLSHDGGRTFAEILTTLDELGYDAEWQVLNSKYFVPQNRERIFIVGHLRGERTRQIFPIKEGIRKYDEKPVQKFCGDGLTTLFKVSYTESTRRDLLSSHQIRHLTPLEYERLQGFPDGWTKGLSDTQRYKCLGNAVTVPVIEYILERLSRD